jgi:HPt (histidine-containing phosphotransfer) domain-containing protein
MNSTPDVTDRPVTAHVDTLRTTLQSVIGQLRGLDTTSLEPALTVQLDTLHLACHSLHAELTDGEAASPHQPTQNLLDHAVFDRLITLAGPDTAPDLLDRLIEDLDAVRGSLQQAAHTSDWDVLRMQSHILIGLAGAVGAHGLHRLARTFNNIANQADHRQLAPALATVNPVLDALVQFLDTRRQHRIAAQ